MNKTYSDKLRRRFLNTIESKWIKNNHDLQKVSCVYVIINYNCINPSIRDIEYIGSTTNLKYRYRSHKIPDKIQASGGINILYFIPMKTGFYDYEIKLINKLKPKYNKQHKNG